MKIVPRIYADRPGDDVASPFFEREFGIESALLAVRVARSAKYLLDNKPQSVGAIGVFPAVVYGPFIRNSGCGTAGQWPIKISHEPGSFFPLGSTEVQWSLDLPFGLLKGSFMVSVVNDDEETSTKPAATCELTTARGSVIALDTPLPSIAIPAISDAHLPIAVNRYMRKADEARAHILQATSKLLYKVVNRLQDGFTLNIDADDAYQLASLETLRLIDRFACSERPRVSWGRFVALYANRAVVRALEQERRIGRPEKALRRLMDEHPELQGSSIKELRAELEKSINEAAGWSDRRIALAIAGPIVETPASSPEWLDKVANKNVSVEDGLPVDMLVAAISSDPRFLAAIQPFLISEALADDPSHTVLSDRKRRRSRQSLVGGVAKALEIEASTPRQLIEAFAEQGERFEDSGDRQRMETRARRAVVALMERGA